MTEPHFEFLRQQDYAFVLHEVQEDDDVLDVSVPRIEFLLLLCVQ